MHLNWLSRKAKIKKGQLSYAMVEMHTNQSIKIPINKEISSKLKSKPKIINFNEIRFNHTRHDLFKCFKNIELDSTITTLDENIKKVFELFFPNSDARLETRRN